jgi:hypothetical protein
VDGARLDGDDLAGRRRHLAPPAAELERALENLEALALEGVDVGRGDAAARLHGGLDLHELAARLG